MIIRMDQEVAKWKHTYKLTIVDKTYYGYANRRIALESRQITLHDENNDEVFKIMEKSKLTLLIDKIPILNWFDSIVFEINRKNEKIGEINVPKNFIQNKYFLNVNNVMFSCYYHRGGMKGDTYSIFKNDVQIGRINRDKKVNWNAHSYYGEFDYDTDQQLNAIFIILIDVLWHTKDINNSMYQTSYEANWGLDMKYGRKPNLNWEPKINSE